MRHGRPRWPTAASFSTRSIPTHRRSGAGSTGRSSAAKRSSDTSARRLARVVAERAPRVMTIVGEPGIGKSRLVAELAAIAGEQATVLTGHCPPYGDGVTYWPLREIVLQAAGDRSLDELAMALGVEPAVARRLATAPSLEQGEGGDETRWAFLQLVGALARAGPLMVVVDDVHWAEPALLDLLLDVGARLRDTPVLLVCVARPDLLEARPGWASGIAHASTLTLGPLSAAASATLLGDVAGGDLGPDDERRIADAAGGNPLFLEQLVAYVGEQRSTDALPPAIHALLAARLDRLDAGERSALALGAVAGDSFEAASVHALASGVTRAEVEQACDRLVERDLLVRGTAGLTGVALRFRHALIHDAAYASLAKSARARLHERHAAWLASLGDDVPEADARIGFHLETACRYAREVGGHAPAAPGDAGRPPARGGGRRRARAREHPRADRLPRTRRGVAGQRSSRGRRALPRARPRALRGGLDRPRDAGRRTRRVGGRGARPAPRAGARRRRARAYPALREPRELRRRKRDPGRRAGDGDARGARRRARARARRLHDVRPRMAEARAGDRRRPRRADARPRPHGGQRLRRRQGDHLRELEPRGRPHAGPGGAGAVRRAGARGGRSARRRDGCARLPGHPPGDGGALRRGARGDGAGPREPGRARTRRDRAPTSHSSTRSWRPSRGTRPRPSAPCSTRAPSSPSPAIAGSCRWSMSISPTRSSLRIAPPTRRPRWRGSTTAPAPCDPQWTIKRHGARALLASSRGDHDQAVREARAAADLADQPELILLAANAQRTLAEVLRGGGREADAADAGRSRPGARRGEGEHCRRRGDAAALRRAGAPGPLAGARRA